MNRRGFFGTLVGAVAARVLPKPAARKRKAPELAPPPRYFTDDDEIPYQPFPEDYYSRSYTKLWKRR